MPSKHPILQNNFETESGSGPQNAPTPVVGASGARPATANKRGPTMASENDTRDAAIAAGFIPQAGSSPPSNDTAVGASGARPAAEAKERGWG